MTKFKCIVIAVQSLLTTTNIITNQPQQIDWSKVCLT